MSVRVWVDPIPTKGQNSTLYTPCLCVNQLIGAGEGCGGGRDSEYVLQC